MFPAVDLTWWPWTPKPALYQSNILHHCSLHHNSANKLVLCAFHCIELPHTIFPCNPWITLNFAWRFTKNTICSLYVYELIFQLIKFFSCWTVLTFENYFPSSSAVFITPFSISQCAHFFLSLGNKVAVPLSIGHI